MSGQTPEQRITDIAEVLRLVGDLCTRANADYLAAEIVKADTAAPYGTVILDRWTSVLQRDSDGLWRQSARSGRMSDKFSIVKNGDRDGPWYLEYPFGFDDYVNGEGCVGVLCATFTEALAQFRVDELRWCIMGCQKGAVEDRDWGWECTACGQYDVAVGCVRP